MLQITAGGGPRLVLQNDTKREYAYDRKSLLGRLDKCARQRARQGRDGS